MKFSKLLKSKKALSPIFAVLILIAIAVIAGIVVYMFTSGTIATMTGGGTAGQEKVAVQGVSVSANRAYAQNTGGVNVTITDYIIKNSAGTIVAQAATGPTQLLVGGGLVPVVISTAACTAGDSYTVTLVSSKGGSFVSSSFVP